MTPWAFVAQSGAEPGGLVYWIDRLARAPISAVVLFAAVCTLVRLAVHPVLMTVQLHKRGPGYWVARFANEVSDALVYAVIVVALLLRPFVVQTFFIPTGSMIDTLLIHDYIVANKFIYRTSEPKRGDIVVFKPPKHGLLPGQGDTDYIKRLVGTPGDVVEIRDNKLYLNGKPQEEPYVTFTYTDLMHGQIGTTPMPKSEWPSVRIPDFKLIDYEGHMIPVLSFGIEVNSESTGTAPVFQVESQESPMAQALRQAPPAKIPKGYFLMMGDNRNGSYDGRSWGLVPRSQIIGRSELIWFPMSRWRVTR